MPPEKSPTRTQAEWEAYDDSPRPRVSTVARCALLTCTLLLALAVRAATSEALSSHTVDRDIFNLVISGLSIAITALSGTVVWLSRSKDLQVKANRADLKETQKILIHFLEHERKGHPTAVDADVARVIDRRAGQ